MAAGAGHLLLPTEMTGVLHAQRVTYTDTSTTEDWSLGGAIVREGFGVSLQVWK